MPDENGCFAYGEKETEYLKKDKKLAEVIDRVGHVYRKTDPDLFSAVMRHIVGQQISTKAQATVWQRALDKFSAVTPEAIDHASVEDIQSVGISFRKAGYMKDFARKVVSGEFDLAAVEHMSDEEAIEALSSLKGIGVWTAEMLLIFSLGRQDVLSYGDFGIRQGIMRLYGHKVLPRERFLRYRKRYSPYGSIAAFYLWELAGE